MFGNNRPRSAEPSTNSGLYQVHEIFTTVQGEGPFSGEEAIFIRLSGCNLRCWFCDTPWDDDAPYISTRQVVDLVLDQHHKETKNADGRRGLIVITGGEPMRQDLVPLVSVLRQYGHRVQIETAGTLFDQRLADLGVHFVVSPKTGRVHQGFIDNLSHWKYVIQAGKVDADGFPSGGFQKIDSGEHVGPPVARPPKGRTVPLYFTPCDEYDDAKNHANLQAAVEAARINGGKAQVQLHKLAGME